MASSTLSLSQFPGNMDCQIVGNTDSAVNYQLTIAFGMRVVLTQANGT